MAKPRIAGRQGCRHIMISWRHTITSDIWSSRGNPRYLGMTMGVKSEIWGYLSCNPTFPNHTQPTSVDLEIKAPFGIRGLSSPTTPF